MDDTAYLQWIQNELTFGLDGKPPKEVGMAPEKIGQISDMDRFTQPLVAGTPIIDDFVASAVGSSKIYLPEGYAQMQEAMKIVKDDIVKTQGSVMAKYGEIRLSVRQSRNARVGQDQGDWHIEPDRNPDSVDHDVQYLMSNVDGTLVQTQPIKATAPDRTDPSRNSVAGTFNGMKTQILIDAELARQAEPGEILRLYQTAHAIAPTTESERTMMRVTFVPPTLDTLREISQEEQALLPEHIRSQL